LGTTIIIKSFAVEPDADTAEEKVPLKSAALQAMRDRADAATISSVNDPAHRIDLIKDPLLHYDNVENNIFGSSLWAFGDGGRPQVLLKVEAHRWNGDELPRVTWVYCFVSISDKNIRATWPNGLRYKTREPGLKPGTFADAPKPAATKAGRLTQMKELARRFWVGDAKKPDRSFRPLPTPIYRYTDEQAGVKDGAVFGFVETGTNPSAVLTLELSQRTDAGDGDGGTTDADAKWQYSLARLGTGQVAAKLEGRTVYETAYTGVMPVQEPTWMWFFEKGTMPSEKKEEE
jgi:hypothetical protein